MLRVKVYVHGGPLSGAEYPPACIEPVSCCSTAWVALVIDDLDSDKVITRFAVQDADMERVRAAGGPRDLLASVDTRQMNNYYGCVSPCGRFVASSGDLLASVDTRQMNNYYGCVSPCGRFVASSVRTKALAYIIALLRGPETGFTPDVKVWEVCFNKTGDFKEVKRAFELKGHTSGVFCFAFSNDSSRMASVSRDGTWKLWDCNIEYQKGQEPYLLTTGKFPPVGEGATPRCLALSPDGRTVAIATDDESRWTLGPQAAAHVSAADESGPASSAAHSKTGTTSLKVTRIDWGGGSLKFGTILDRARLDHRGNTLGVVG
ncbi:hypothetical protein HPB50_018258 [Hyalomma asiaticum]|uniref:Uncharacterized protein n=1 Tax=Hyalomma asiaticum TaxID=266040 RepID=A0ACB7SIN2_HYAAI|nr:hypothetical protein HPB50_018258 [Hyalomma asiaticum]